MSFEVRTANRFGEINGLDFLTSWKGEVEVFDSGVGVLGKQLTGFLWPEKLSEPITERNVRTCVHGEHYRRAGFVSLFDLYNTDLIKRKQDGKWSVSYKNSWRDESTQCFGYWLMCEHCIIQCLLLHIPALTIFITYMNFSVSAPYKNLTLMFYRLQVHVNIKNIITFVRSTLMNIFQ